MGKGDGVCERGGQGREVSAGEQALGCGSGVAEEVRRHERGMMGVSCVGEEAHHRDIEPNTPKTGRTVCKNAAFRSIFSLRLFSQKNFLLWLASKTRLTVQTIFHPTTLPKPVEARPAKAKSLPVFSFSFCFFFWFFFVL